MTLLKDKPHGVRPIEIAEALGVGGAVVRSHLNRHKGTLYKNRGGRWHLLGRQEDQRDHEDSG